MSSFFGGGSKHVAPVQVDRDKFKVKNADKLQGQIDGARNQANARANQSNRATQGLITDLTKQARGEGPSLAEAQLKQAQDRTLAQQLAAVQAGRPGNTALAGRNALRAGIAAQQGNAQQAAQARIQEQLNAQNLLSQTAGQQNALQGQLAQNALGQSLGLSQVQTQTGIAGETLQNQNNLAAQGIEQKNAEERANRSQQLLGTLLGAGSQVASAFATKSDKAAKKNIKKAGKDMDSFLSALSASKYNYKDESQAGTFKGDNYGVMAQDLEKSEVGKTLVEDTPNGKMVDTKKGFGAVLAAQSRMHERVAGLEKLLGKKKEKKNG